MLSFSYARLASREAQLVQNRQSLPRFGSWWRPLHLLLAWLFLAGVIIHIIVVTFFAGYAADGSNIYWWHVTAW
jgi:quinol-cytochrome oxidoreductase complex cytochrome b subunit